MNIQMQKENERKVESKKKKMGGKKYKERNANSEKNK
jgi:hypothetical protein